MRKTTLLAGCLSLVSLAVLLSGCAGVRDTMRLSEKNSIWNPVQQLKENKAEEAEPSEPHTMTVLWKESVFDVTGSKPVRGFGGRVFFYDINNNAVKADGELTIYGFDESANEKASSAPDKKFEFSSEELDSLFDDSGLGPSYSVWVPWDKVGGMRKSIALIPMFKTANGQIIKAGQSLGVLPGKVEEKSDVTDSRPYKVLGSSPAVVDQNSASHSRQKTGDPIAQVSYENEMVVEADPQAKRIKTSTIRMTPGLAERIAKQRRSEARSRKSNDTQSASEIRTEIRSKLNTRKNLETVKQNTTRGAAWSDGLKATVDPEPGTEDQSRKVFGAPGSFN